MATSTAADVISSILYISAATAAAFLCGGTANLTFYYIFIVHYLGFTSRANVWNTVTLVNGVVHVLILQHSLVFIFIVLAHVR